MKNKIIGLSLIVLGLIVIGIFLYGGPLEKENEGIPENLRCEVDSDCVPKQQCHPTDCVSSGFEDSVNGERVFCTQECQPGTLDCGQGYCACNQGKCEAVFGNKV